MFLSSVRFGWIWLTQFCDLYLAIGHSEWTSPALSLAGGILWKDLFFSGVAKLLAYEQEGATMRGYPAYKWSGVLLCEIDTAMDGERNISLHLDPTVHEGSSKIPTGESITILFCSDLFSLGFYHLQPEVLTKVTLFFFF